MLFQKKRYSLPPPSRKKPLSRKIALREFRAARCAFTSALLSPRETYVFACDSKALFKIYCCTNQKTKKPKKQFSTHKKNAKKLKKLKKKLAKKDKLVHNDIRTSRTRPRDEKSQKIRNIRARFVFLWSPKGVN